MLHGAAAPELPPRGLGQSARGLDASLNAPRRQTPRAGAFHHQRAYGRSRSGILAGGSVAHSSNSSMMDDDEDDARARGAARGAVFLDDIAAQCHTLIGRLKRATGGDARSAGAAIALMSLADFAVSGPEQRRAVHAQGGVQVVVPLLAAPQETLQKNAAAALANLAIDAAVARCIGSETSCTGLLYASVGSS